MVLVRLIMSNLIIDNIFGEESFKIIKYSSRLIAVLVRWSVTLFDF